MGLRFYPGGIQGEELVVLRKIRAGQLHGGGFTGVGLGEIAPTLRVMELPFLFQDAAEVRAVHEKMDPVFEKTLHDAGYTLVGWAEVGFVYLYSKNAGGLHRRPEGAEGLALGGGSAGRGVPARRPGSRRCRSPSPTC